MNALLNARNLFVFALCTTSFFFSGQCHGQIVYRVEDLGDLPGGDDYSFAVAINDHGNITGTSDTAPMMFDSAFFWSPATGMVDLATSTGEAELQASDINNDNVIVGSDYGATPEGFTWSQQSGLQHIGTYAGGLTSSVSGINEFGVVTGTSNYVAFRWDPTNGFLDIGNLGLTAGAGAINDFGQISGASFVGQNQIHAFLYDPNTGMQDLGELPGGNVYSGGNDLNNLGTVVGSSSGEDEITYAVMWTRANGLVQLDDVPGVAPENSFAGAVNDKDQVVGSSGSDGTIHNGVGFIFSDALGMNNLNDMLDASGDDWTIRSANDINEFGQIAANGIRYFPTMHHALRLTPVSAAPDSLTVNNGTLDSGNVDQLTISDNIDLSVTRAALGIQPVVQVVIKSAIPETDPATFGFTLESSVFARVNIAQTIELFNYTSGTYEQIDSRNATRIVDSTVTASPTGNLTRFIESGTQCVQARVTYSAANNRARFTANIDRMTWEF